MIRIAQAGSDENYHITNGRAGDQRKTSPDANGCFQGELNVQPWYSKPWDYLIRPNSETVANAIAGNMHAICQNRNVGYDQNQDETLWEAFDKLGWSPLAIPHLPLCETDCCRLLDVCVRLAGIKNIPNLRHKYTGNIRNALEASGHFTVYSDKALTQSTAKLRRGDILLQEGHHVVVVLDTAEDPGKPYKIWNCLACCLRDQGSTKGKVLAYLHPGDVVQLQGWAPSGWGKVTYNGTAGYVSPKYLVATSKVKTTGKIYLRSGAGTNTAALTVIPSGTSLEWNGSTAQNGGTTWYAVSYGGYSGFISGRYTQVLG